MLYVNIHSNINRKMLSLVISSYDCKTKITSSTSVYSPKPNNLVQEEHIHRIHKNTNRQRYNMYIQVHFHTGKKI